MSKIKFQGTSLLPVWPPAKDPSQFCNFYIGEEVVVRPYSKKTNPRSLEEFSGVVIAARGFDISNEKGLILIVYMNPRRLRYAKEIVAEWLHPSKLSHKADRTFEEWLTSDHDVLRKYFVECVRNNVKILIREEGQDSFQDMMIGLGLFT
jgi:hypothetical protein